ncbi:hypothetical protein AWB67_00699 [Caballeronia terrestris]|jgi:hypothetical protein|uniref:Uncharacterized protein n=1 Tax=Caballeronia terrestris TaxID=1226301 RepID=A0A158FM78_9BURK|nr:hypothetical protein [Caballeronia terrestris]SAL20731.1 hypothetical protein AWB67_00699 [Caballeronia terrestris]
MNAVKTVHVRRGYVAVCLVIGAVCVLATMDYGKTIDKLNVDTQLPLERLAVDSEHAAAVNTVRADAPVRGMP